MTTIYAILKFKGIERNPPKEFHVTQDMVRSREIYVGIPKETTLKQFNEIQSSVNKAEEHGIKITLKIEE